MFGEYPYHQPSTPSHEESMAKVLERSGCNTGARVIVEKPFGQDLTSAKTLNITLQAVFPEASIFQTDFIQDL